MYFLGAKNGIFLYKKEQFPVPDPVITPLLNFLIYNVIAENQSVRKAGT